MSNRNGRSLSSNVPAHKQTDPRMKPGQQVYPYTNPLGFVIQPSETTLKEYIARKQDAKKLTFDEWFFNSFWRDREPWPEKDDWSIDAIAVRGIKEKMQLAWKAAQENM